MMQEDPCHSRRPGPTAGLLCGILFVGSALVVLCSSYRSLDGNQQRIGRSQRDVQQTAGPNSSSPPPEKPVAFLSVPMDNRSDSSRVCDEAVVWWKVETTLRGGFKYEEGQLVVPIKGRYWVYFQLNYSTTGNALGCSKPLMLSQGVIWVRESYKDNHTLLQVQDTVPDHKHIFIKTLQASAAFDLDAGDRLFVLTNSPGLLSTVGYLGADLEL